MKEVSLQGWGYTVDVKDARIDNVAVHYDSSSREGVEAFAAAQREENEELFKSGTEAVDGASIVFKRALSWDEADALVQKYDIYATAYEFYGLSATDSDDIYSFALGLVRDGKSGQPFDNSVRGVVDQKIERTFGDKVALKGIAAINANLTKEQYTKLVSDPNVYLVDMSQQVVKAKILKGEVPELQGVQVGEWDQVNITGVVGPLYRNMVKNQMMK